MMVVKEVRDVILAGKLYDQLEETSRYLGYNRVGKYASLLLEMVAHEQWVKTQSSEQRVNKDE